MKFSRSIAALLLASTFAARAEIPAGWGTNFTAVMKDATNAQTPVLVFFTASWCGPCKLMAHTTFLDAQVIAALLAVPRVAIDIDEQSALAGQHGIQAVPTLKLLTPDGETVVSTTGYQTPDQFLPWLTNGIAEARVTVARLAKAKADLADTDQLLAASDLDFVRKGAQKIFELCADHDKNISDAAVARMKPLAQTHPEILLEGLNHPRLAARIQSANILRAKMGDAFDVDPWSDAATRAKAVAQWTDRLAKNN